MKTKKQFSLMSVLLTALLVAANLVVANMIFRTVDQRVDLTEDKRFEIGQGTSNILSRLDDIAVVKCYVSSNLPKRYAPLERSLIEKLQEYEEEADEKFVFEFVDPDVDEAAKQECDDLGIQPARLSEFERTTSSVVSSYMAMVFRYGDRKKIVNFFVDMRSSLDDRNDFVAALEYHITRSIQAVSSPRKTVALLADTQMVPADRRNPRGPTQPYQGLSNVKAVLSRSYDVLELDIKEVNRGTDIDEGIDVLVVHGVKETTPIARYLIDQFIMRGGNVLFMVDSGTVAVEAQPKQTTIGNQRVRDFDLPTYEGRLIDHGLNALFENYGFQIEPEFVLDPSAFKSQYITDKELKRNILRQVVVTPVTGTGPYFNWPLVPARDDDGELLDEDQVAKGQALFSRRDTVVFTHVSPITLLESRLKKQGAKSSVLLRSGPSSWTRPIKGEVFSPDPKLQFATPGEGKFPIAVMISGEFRSAFITEDIPAVTGANGDPLPVPEERTRSKRDLRGDEGTLIAIGDADCVTDRFLAGVVQIEAQINKINNEGLARRKALAMVKLVGNSVDLLCYGGEAGDLFDVKNKASVRSRALKPVDENEDIKRRIDLVIFLLIPGGIVVIGLLRWAFRRFTAVAA